jgi:hypothetical protein
MKYEKLLEEIKSGEYRIGIYMPSFCTVNGLYCPCSYEMTMLMAVDLVEEFYAFATQEGTEIEFKVSFTEDWLYLHTNTPITH